VNRESFIDFNFCHAIHRWRTRLAAVRVLRAMAEVGGDAGDSEQVAGMLHTSLISLMRAT
jgi:hypothetical protein